MKRENRKIVDEFKNEVFLFVVSVYTTYIYIHVGIIYCIYDNVLSDMGAIIK